MNQDASSRAAPAFLGLVFLSGAASLIYEVLWTRTLLSTFGASVYASGTVLSAFMAGLAIGAAFAGRFADRTRFHPLRVYGFLELLIGVYALLFPFILDGITAIHVSAFREFHASFTLFSMIRFALAFLGLVIPAILMGATLPVLTRHGVSHIKALGLELGRLYAVNTAGAACGTFLAGYFLIEWMGIRNSTYLAVGINLIVFLGAFALTTTKATDETAAPEKAADGGRKRGRPKSAAPAPSAWLPEGSVDRRLVLLVIAISGFSALAYEVLWSRILVYILGNFVHSFSVMLSTFLIGIALGSWLLGRFADRIAKPWLLLALFQAVIGLLAIFILPAFGGLIQWRDAFLTSLEAPASLTTYKDPWWVFTFWKLGASFLLMILPTLCMGASFPLAGRLFVKDRDQLGRGIASVYSSNTVGAILGAFSASFLLIPWIGVRNAALAAAVVNLIGAALLLARNKGSWSMPRMTVAALGVVIIAFMGFSLVGNDVFHPIYAQAEKNKRLIYVDESVSGTVTIHETSGGFRVIDINGLNVAGTKFGFLCTQKLQAHYPLLMHENPKQIMQIGFGTGGTCFSVGTHSEVERVDCVEINPGIIEAAPFFLDNNQDILSDPRVNVNIEDARNFVLSTDKRYDIILSDSIHPRFTGNGLLYTEDYFKLCAQIMEADGIFSTWLPTAFLGDEEFRIIVRSMQSVFPHILVWYMNNTVEGYTITMGSRQPFRVDFEQLAERMSRPALAADLEQVHIENPYDFLDCILLSGSRVADYLDKGPLNTEDHPIIEFRAPRNMNRVVTEFRNLERMMEYRSFPTSVIDWGDDSQLGAERRATLERYYGGTGYILAAHQYHLLSKVREEASYLSRAMEINPDDRDAPFLAERLQEMMGGRKVDW